LSASRSPYKFNKIICRKRHDKVDGADYIAMHSAVTGNDAELAISVRNVSRATGIVFSQPHISVMDLRVAVGELNRKGEAINTRIRKGDATS
jgi:hypothetical protein